MRIAKFYARSPPQCDSGASVRALEKAQETLGGNYAGELVRLNGADEYGGKWWPGKAHPANLIVFAAGDPWILA